MCMLFADGDFVLKTPRYVDPEPTAVSLTPVNIDIDYKNTSTNTKSQSLNTKNIPSKGPVDSKDSICKEKDKNRWYSRAQDSDTVGVLDVAKPGEIKATKVDQVDAAEEIRMGNVEVKQYPEEEGEDYVVVEIVDGKVVTDIVDNNLDKEVTERRNVENSEKVGTLGKGDDDYSSQRGVIDNELIEKVKDGVVLTKTESSQDNAVVIENVKESQSSKSPGKNLEDEGK